MLRYPISTILWLAKQSIKDKIQDALKLHNNIDAYITIEIKDKNGNIIKRHKQKSHSFVANFLLMINSMMTANGLNLTDISGTITQPDLGTDCYLEFSLNVSKVSGTLGNMGIVIGTGTATPTPQDYKLGNQIANGTGSGQMEYSSIIITNPTVNGNTTSFQISQTYTNNSGASITVTEVGLQVYFYNSSPGPDYMLIIHDLLSSPITVPNGGVLGITYTISTTT